MSDLIERQESKDISEINKFIDGLEEIFADLRERHVDDSVCGLCEYDGAYIGQSGDWCNECPGFDKDDCFKLSDETRKKWIEKIVNAYPDHTADIGKKAEGDCISRQAALDALRSCQTYLFDAKDPDKKIELRSAELVIEGLPPVQPETHWIPCSERLPERADNVIICYKAGDYTLVSTGRYLYKFKMWYVDVVGDLRDGVTAWMPMPDPYRGGEKDDR